MAGLTSQWSAARLSEPQLGITQQFIRARTLFSGFRTAMRQMGEAADVPIEPPEQQRLLDATERCIGVIGSGVPGAGGYDAVWILVLDSDETQVVAPIERLWNEWEEMQVKPLSSKARVHGGRIAQGDGLRFEQMSAVDGLTYAVL